MNGLCTLTAVSWEGDLPMTGQYLKAKRGRTAFRIVAITELRKRPARHVAKFTCERHAASRLTSADVVHVWKWATR